MLTPMELFGIECGKGWMSLVEPLYIECTRHGGTILQIKEKFGGLRFYYSPGMGNFDDPFWQQFQTKVDKAESDSYTICEDCGKPGVRRMNGWIRTLCDTHAKEHGYE